MRQYTIVAAVAVTILIAMSTARADWPHDVKWDQLDPCSVWVWQSYVNEQEDYIVADDFRCDETGWITDIEFYGYTGNLDALSQFRITFWTDAPATANDASHPDVLRREVYVSKACPCDPNGLGWQVLVQGADTILFKINLPEDDWFRQDVGNIYWVGIQGVMAADAGFYWKFRDPTTTTTNLDDAVSMGLAAPVDEWAHLAWFSSIPTTYHGTIPFGYVSADMAFKLTGTAIPEPATLGLVCFLGLLLMRRRKL